MDRSKVIFGNEISNKDYKKACKSKENYIKKFGDDSHVNYPVKIRRNPILGDVFNLQDILLPEELSNTDTLSDTFDDKGIIIGNIRMGFGHYRISMAIASCAHALGYTPYWFDLNSFPQTTCSKVISHQNDLYSLGSRLSKNYLFNRFVWEPMNYEGFRSLAYNAKDQKNSELFTSVFRNIPKDMPLIASHAWVAQGAIHSNMTHVVNAIPDNWPMALHFAQGSKHTIQCKQAYHGYKVLNGMTKGEAINMPDDSLYYTGHYVDHELVSHIDIDCQRRIERVKNNEPLRFLLTIGGAGAQKDIFKDIIIHLLPYINKNKVALYINVGDYKNVWDDLKNEIEEMKPYINEHLNDYGDTLSFANEALTSKVSGIHAFYHHNIFEAVYATNLLMRSSDVLVTKPSELSFYPIPKLFIKRVGKHEMWGAIHSSEVGDGTMECRDIKLVKQMLDTFINDKDYLIDMCLNIVNNNKNGLYDGGYKAVKLAIGDDLNE